MAAAYSLAGNVALRTLNTFGVDATAACLATVHDAQALPEVLALPPAGPGAMVLGEGSNVLFAADYPGTILRLAFAAVRLVADDGDSALVRAEAGCRWDPLVDWTLQQGLCGLENLALIPGLAGAAPIQNIGAYGTEIGEFIAAVEAYDRTAGRLVRLEHAACGFGYRDSVFKADLARWIVCAIELRLPRRREFALGYAGVADELAAMGVTTPTAPAVAAAVRRLRTRKLPDPAVIGNAGSFFKNPIVPAAQADALRSAHPALPVYPAGDECKLSAAWLIEQCGLKGWRDGDAGMSAQHALVLVNHGHATGAQLLAVARRVARTVQDRYGVALEPEPRIIGATF
ncbi:MAG TPA: UDP-N-acetylmuramate dehydrogenase [Steroidobacteraceae bacterium]